MGKRKRTQPQASGADRAVVFDPAASKLTIKTYQDVGDSEDEFHTNRDKILLDNGPDAKRRKQRAEEDEEFSDEEVLGFSENDDYEDEDPDGNEEAREDSAGEDDSQASGGGSGEDEEDTIGGWGPKKSDYYNADEAETEQDMLDEEAEARRIQQRQRKALSEADFGFDEDAWADPSEQEGEAALESRGGVVTEVLPQLQVTDDMTAAQRLKLLKTRYPEFEPLANELARLQSVYQEVYETASPWIASPTSFEDDAVPMDLIKFRALSGYMGALAMYFALLTSTADEDASKSLPMPASELREHDVIASLEQYQRLWATIEKLDAPESDSEEDEDSDLDESMMDAEDESIDEDTPESELDDGDEEPAPKDAARIASQARREARMRKTEESLAALSSMALKEASSRARTTTAAAAESDGDSDLGDEQPLLPHEAAEKARKRKSLRFYTSQIAQKANKRANAGRAAGGDDDIPHRERLRDRQDRLNREAENRGKKGDLGGNGAELNDDDDDAPMATNREREEDMSEGEQALEMRVLAKKTAKLDKAEAYRIAKEEGGKVVVRKENTIGPDGRRQVGYVIEKNKGLTPKRKKIVKNPRVKKRKKFEDKSKKLRSMKATFKGGEGKGGYGGELTGIKKNLVRSVKL